ncbi:MAG: hypothetical protein B7Z67_00855 [Acidiphilium sp. 21-60-14]|nr:MAG: hypothetical protein B7Z67_00855 [Acidiphilium sp. 21-60-14]OYV90587.1 MAG: hypothetical protein B7Z57_08175 [Acidiphilium sp. 37-60-79]OZB41511.1 MAG: hypothetical protein B7X48_00385 [Acidiphilium sp. 34-60-192]
MEALMARWRLGLVPALALMMPLAGCGTMVDGVNQSMVVKTTWAGHPVRGAFCTLTNNRGRWFVRTPGSVVVRQSNSPMAVECTKAGYLANLGAVNSHTRFIAFANPVAGLMVGTLVDMGTGGAYKYPDVVTVTMVNRADLPPQTASR